MVMNNIRFLKEKYPSSSVSSVKKKFKFLDWRITMKVTQLEKCDFSDVYKLECCRDTVRLIVKYLSV